MKTEYIVGGIVVAALVGVAVLSSKSSKAAPPPPSLPPTVWKDYKVVQLGPGDSIVGLSSPGGVIREFQQGDSYVYSVQENQAFVAKQLGATPETYPPGVTYGPSKSSVPMGVFYANDSTGTTTRYLTPITLAV